MNKDAHTCIPACSPKSICNVFPNSYKDEHNDSHGNVIIPGCICICRYMNTPLLPQLSCLWEVNLSICNFVQLLPVVVSVVHHWTAEAKGIFYSRSTHNVRTEDDGELSEGISTSTLIRSGNNILLQITPDHRPFSFMLSVGPVLAT